MIVCVGESLIDLIPLAHPTGTAFHAAPGGCPYNAAVACGRLGAPVAFLGRMSTDFFGDQLVERLRTNGVATDLIVRSNQPTTLAFVSRDERGDARYAFYANNSADRNLSMGDIPAVLSAAVDCILFGSISLLMRPGADVVAALVQRERGARVLSFDPNIRPALIADRDGYLRLFTALSAAATIVKVSDADLEWLYPHDSWEDAARRLVRDGSTLVVVTRGAAGSWALTANADSSVAAAPIVDPEPAADTIGAGDSFHAGLVTYLHEQGLLSPAAIAALSAEQLTDCLAFAGRVAAFTCSRAGADPPFRHQLPAVAGR